MKTIKHLMILATSVLLLTVTAHATEASLAAQISAQPVFPTPLQWVGSQPPPENESAALLSAIKEVAVNGRKTGFTPLESFIAEYPQSAWTPSLRASLAEYYRQNGEYNEALAHWKVAWSQTKDHHDARSQELAARIVANWMRLLASLGQKDQLNAIFAEIQSLQLPLGAYGSMVDEIRGGLVVMNQSPRLSYRCGSLALSQVARALKMEDLSRRFSRVDSPDGGFTVAELLVMAKTNGLAMEAVRRPTGAEIIVPSVIHWKLNHYAAITGKRGDRYYVVDPTFERSLWLDKETIDKEASGAFLVPKGKAPQGWKQLSREECQDTYGKGYIHVMDPDMDCGSSGNSGGGGGGGGSGSGGSGNGASTPGGSGPAGSPGAGGGGCTSGGCSSGNGDSGGSCPNNPNCAGDNSGGGGPCCGNNNNNGPGGPGGRGGPGGLNNGVMAGSVSGAGMPQWSVSEPYVALWLHDVPLFYNRADGRQMLRLSYKQTDVAPSSLVGGFGAKWECNWLSTVETESTNSDSTTVNFAGGGQWSLINDGTPDYKTAWRLLGANTNTGAVFPTAYIEEPDGTVDNYGNAYNFMSGAALYFQTSRVDPDGRTVTFNYQTNGSIVRLVSLWDRDGRTNTLTYGNSTYSNLITAVTDPYGSTAHFNYDGSGRLTNIVDMSGMSSSFQYDANDNITNMTTLYGETAFLFQSGTSTNYDGPRTSILITEASGDQQLYEYCALGPDGEGCSYHWNRAQYQAIDASGKNYNIDMDANDYDIAHVQKWFGVDNTTPETLSDALMFSADPEDPALGGWRRGEVSYTYVGGLQGDSGALEQIATIAVTQPNYGYPSGSVTRRTYTRNSIGYATSILDGYAGDPFDAGTIGFALYTNTYDASGHNLLTQYGPGGELVAGCGYHSVYTNLLTSITNALGYVTRYTYNTNTMKLTSIIFPTGLVHTNIYYTNGPNAGFLLEQADIGFRTNSYAYSNGNLVSHTNELGLVTSMTWDSLNRLVCTTYPDGTTVSNLYNKLDIVGAKDRLNNWTHYGYNAIDQLVDVTNADSEVTDYSYCGCGSPSEITQYNGLTALTTMYDYDIQGDATNVAYPDGYEVNYHYDLENLRTNASDSGGRSWLYIYAYSGLANPVYTVSIGSQTIVTKTCDQYGRAVTVEDAYDDSVTNGYDFLDRLIVRETENNVVAPVCSEGFAYNASGLIGYTNKLGYVTGYGRDALGRLLTTTNADNQVNNYTYNPSSDLLTLTDGKNQTTTWGYDQFGRVTNKVDAAGNTILTYQYDADSRLTNRWSNAKGNTAYGYDALGNLTNVAYPGSVTLAYAYDSLNRLTSMSDPVGTTTFSWTEGNQLASETGPWAEDTVNYTYNNRMRSNLSLSQPNASAWVQTYGYNTELLLTNTTSPAGPFNYSYGTYNLPSQVQLPGFASSDGVSYGYDSLARMNDVKLLPDSTPEPEHKYTFDNASEITQQTIYDGSSISHYWNYAYDDISQLTTAQGFESAGTPRTQEQLGYAYDAAGNLTYRTNYAMLQTFNVNNLNELTNMSRTGTLTVAGKASEIGADITSITLTGTGVTGGLANSYSNLYADGSWAITNVALVNGTNTYTASALDYLSRTSQANVTVYLPATNTCVYDLNGNLCTNGGMVFQYDVENQLTNVMVTNQWCSQFVYDGKLRRRIERDYEWDNGAWLETNETRYIYDGNLVLQERNAQNLPQVTYTRGNDLSRTLQGAGGIGGLLARTDNSLMIAGSIFAHALYFADGYGNITYMMATNGNMLATYSYDPYGNLLGMSGPLAAANTYRFSSKEIHAASGLYYYGHRYYQPSLQRWLNRDPLTEPGFEVVRHGVSRQPPAVELLEGPDLYEFVANDPISKRDPKGLKFQSQWPTATVDACKDCASFSENPVAAKLGCCVNGHTTCTQGCDEEYGDGAPFQDGQWGDPVALKQCNADCDTKAGQCGLKSYQPKSKPGVQ